MTPTLVGERIALGVILTLSILLVAFTFSPLWEALLLAAVLSSATYGRYRALARRLGNRPRIAAAIMTVLLVVLLLAPLAAVGAVLVREAIQFAAFVQSALEQGGVDELVRMLPGPLEGPARSIAERIAERGELPEQAAAGGLTVAGILRDVVQVAFQVLLGLAMMLIAYYALLLEGPRLLRWVEKASPLHGGRTGELLDEFRRVSRSVLSSALISALSQAVVAGIGYAIAGVPSAVFFAFLTGVAALVPAIGTAIITLPIAAVLVATGGIWQGIFLAIYWALVIAVVDNVVEPLVLKGGMQLSGTLVFFALIGGLLAFGPIGLMLGPLSVTFFLAMVRYARRDFSA